MPIACTPAAEAGQASTTMQGEARAAQEKVKTLETKLDRLVHELQSAVPKRSLELRETQMKWRSFVKADCSWESKFAEGGSVAPLIYANCMETHYTARINRLKPLLCEGGGMTGKCVASEKY